jgi:hypothetical protein
VANITQCARVVCISTVQSFDMRYESESDSELGVKVMSICIGVFRSGNAGSIDIGIPRSIDTHEALVFVIQLKYLTIDGDGGI